HARIQALDGDREFERTADLFRPIELDGGRAHPNEVARWAGHRSVHAEHRDLERLAWLEVPAQQHPVWRVKPLRQGAARLPEDHGELSVHPDLSIVVKHTLEDRRGAPGLESTDLLWNRDASPVPVEAQPASRAASLKGLGFDGLPRRVVEL